MNSYLVYVLECSDGTYYTGITNDLEKRLADHNSGKKGAKYTRGRGPFKLLYQESFEDKGLALRRELEIKALSRQDKERLIRGGGGQTSQKGTLFLCATPIGNLDDITLRVIKTLQQADLIAAEDTRHTRKLLNHLEIVKPMTSYHEHNKLSKGPRLVEELLTGKDIALVSDAGMPGISDPGADLVKLAVKEGIKVVPLPGPSAGITALVISGLDTGKFVFEGFLPVKTGERLKRLETLTREERTMIFYEAPHRIQKTLQAMDQVFGGRSAAVVRELTKKHEEALRGTLPELVNYFAENEPRGEFCLVVEGKEPEDNPIAATDPEVLIAELIAKGLTKKEAIKEGAKILGLPKRDVYKAVLEKRQ